MGEIADRADPIVVVPRHSSVTVSGSTLRAMFTRAGTAKRFPNVSGIPQYMTVRERDEVAIDAVGAVDAVDMMMPPLIRDDDVEAFVRDNVDAVDDEPLVEEEIEIPISDERATQLVWDMINEFNFRRNIDIAGRESTFDAAFARARGHTAQIKAKLAEFADLLNVRLARVFAERGMNETAKKRAVNNLLLRSVHTFDSVLDDPDLGVFFIENEYMGPTPLDAYY